MVTPSTNIGLSDVNTELRNTAGTNIGLGDTNVRALARVPSGNIGLDDLKNKSILTLANNTVEILGGFFSASAGITFNANGTVTLLAMGVPSAGNDWSIIPIPGLSTSNGGYEMRLFESELTISNQFGSTSTNFPGGWTPGNEVMQDIGNGLTWEVFASTELGETSIRLTAGVIIREKLNENTFVTANVVLEAVAFGTG